MNSYIIIIRNSIFKGLIIGRTRIQHEAGSKKEAVLSSMYSQCRTFRTLSLKRRTLKDTNTFMIFMIQNESWLTYAGPVKL
jgi:hypothetical protein